MDKDKKKSLKVSYEPEADVLSWELNDKAIDYAEEAGNVIVHFSKEHIPVLVELLEARNFLSQSKDLVDHRQNQTTIAIPA